MSIILKGIVEYTFNGQLLFRGYAALGDLLNISKPSFYQRKYDDKREKSIGDFLSSATFSFFPELLFGLQFKTPSAIECIANPDITRQDLKEDNIEIKSKGKFSFGKNSDRIDKSTAKVMTLNFKGDNAPLSRLDGNHRLSAAEAILENTPDNAIKDKIVPFSILVQIQGKEADKYEAAFFYLINAKAKALTSEENYEALLAKDDLFSDLELNQILEIQNIELIRSIALAIKSGANSNIKEFIEEGNYDFAVKLVILLGEFGIPLEHNQVFRAIHKVCAIIEEEKYKGKTLSVDIILALIIAILKYPDDFSKVRYWVFEGNLNLLSDVGASCILKTILAIISKREYRIFVAMPYVSHKRVSEYNTLFKEVLAEITKKEKVTLSLIPIMRFRGASQRIDHRLIESIKECDVFIADLTGANENVIFEVGLAEGNGKPMILLRAENDHSTKVPFDVYSEYVKDHKIPFDMDKLQYIPFSMSGYYNDIKSIIKNNLPTILEKKYGVYKP